MCCVLCAEEHKFALHSEYMIEREIGGETGDEAIERGRTGFVFCCRHTILFLFKSILFGIDSGRNVAGSFFNVLFSSMIS